MVKSPLQQLRDGDLPEMVRWYDPRLLSRIFVRTLVSSLFGQYADQRIDSGRQRLRQPQTVAGALRL